jgi:hypothetical protein
VRRRHPGREAAPARPAGPVRRRARAEVEREGQVPEIARRVARRQRLRVPAPIAPVAPPCDAAQNGCMAAAPTSEGIRWYHRRVPVLILLFVVLGPFALPHLWRSPVFSRGMKIVLTLLVVAYTALLVDETIRIVRLTTGELDLLDLR